MRAMRAEGFSGYQDLQLVGIPKPTVSDGRVLVRVTAAGVTPLDHTILFGQFPHAKAPLEERTTKRVTQGLSALVTNSRIGC
jgi:NADPH:quinone reductase